MKRFFTKGLKAVVPANTATPTNPTVPHTTGLQPKYVVPPVPHPCTHDYIALLVTNEGLLLRPQIHGLKDPGPSSHVRISWGKPIKVEELVGDGTSETEDWADSVIVYGIVGVLELFSGMYLAVASFVSDSGSNTNSFLAAYLLVITSRSELGNRKRVVS